MEVDLSVFGALFAENAVAVAIKAHLQIMTDNGEFRNSWRSGGGLQKTAVDCSMSQIYAQKLLFWITHTGY